jgi:hypothetical protein
MVFEVGLHATTAAGGGAAPGAAPAQLAVPSKLVDTLVVTGVGVITN